MLPPQDCRKADDRAAAEQQRSFCMCVRCCTVQTHEHCIRPTLNKLRTNGWNICMTCNEIESLIVCYGICVIHHRLIWHLLFLVKIDTGNGFLWFTGCHIEISGRLTLVTRHDRLLRMKSAQLPTDDAGMRIRSFGRFKNYFATQGILKLIRRQRKNECWIQKTVTCKISAIFFGVYRLRNGIAMWIMSWKGNDAVKELVQWRKS